MNEAVKLALLSVLRSTLIAAGGFAVTKGWISADMLTQIVGAILVVATAAWGAVDKLK